MKKIDTTTILLLIGGAYLVYMLMKPKKTTELAQSAKYQYVFEIVNSGNHVPTEKLLGLEEEFLKAWSEASKAKLPTFVYKGGTYATKGGKSK